MRDPGFILGVDGGNTKTIAVVVAPNGTVAGCARGGCSDVYALPSVTAAVTEISLTCQAALASAGATPSDLDATAYSLAGADWPEDVKELSTHLSTAIAARRQALVCNDGVGALWGAFGSARGAVVACGTYVAVAARGEAGEWNASFWAEPAGAVHLGQAGLHAIYRAELGTGPETALSRTIPITLELHDACTVLHHFTSRSRAKDDAIGRLAPLVLDAAEEGDRVAQQLVDAEAQALATTVDAAARRTKLREPYALALTGGVFNHASERLPLSVQSLAAGRYSVRVAQTQPVAGAVVMAADRAGLAIDHNAISEAIPMLDEIPHWRACSAPAFAQTRP